MVAIHSRLSKRNKERERQEPHSKDRDIPAVHYKTKQNNITTKSLRTIHSVEQLLKEKYNSVFCNRGTIKRRCFCSVVIIKVQLKFTIS